jgi:hypothetical protein
LEARLEMLFILDEELPNLGLILHIDEYANQVVAVALPAVSPLAANGLRLR